MGQGGSLGGFARQLGVIGFPIEHSLSPVMHNEAFRHLNMNAYYGGYAVEPGSLKAAVEGLRALGFLGVNVTIPHKEAIIPYLDEVGPMAQQLGAVNTVVNRGGRLIGYNTDGWGFISSLEEAGVKPSGLHAVVLGAGGAARAIVFHLIMAGAASVTVSNRTLERAEKLASEVRAVHADAQVRGVAAQSAQERQALEGAGLVVNCTPLGMAPANVSLSPVSDMDVLRRDAVVYDTVYRPEETRLLREARERGLTGISGLGMLVHQGACSWEYWFGRQGPVEKMYAAVRKALEEEALKATAREG